MHASTGEATRPFQAAFDAARSKHAGRRNRSRLRHLVSIVASATRACGRGLLRALQDSRRREAARVIDKYRPLLHDSRHAWYPYCGNDTGADAQIKRTED